MLKLTQELEQQILQTQQTKLNLSNFGLSDEDIVILCRLVQAKPTITGLDLSSNSIGSKGAQLLSELNQLKELNLNSNNLGDKGLECLAKGRLQLNVLQVKNNNLTDKSLDILKKLTCPSLEFTDNPALSAEAIKKINLLRQPRFKLSLSKVKSNFSSFSNGYLSTQALREQQQELAASSPTLEHYQPS